MTRPVGIITVAVAARKLGRHPSTIRLWCHAGRLDVFWHDGLMHVSTAQVSTVVPPRVGAPVRNHGTWRHA
jgi:hypothetical protein